MPDIVAGRDAPVGRRTVKRRRRSNRTASHRRHRDRTGEIAHAAVLRVDVLAPARSELSQSPMIWHSGGLGLATAIGLIRDLWPAEVRSARGGRLRPPPCPAAGSSGANQHAIVRMQADDGSCGNGGLMAYETSCRIGSALRKSGALLSSPRPLAEGVPDQRLPPSRDAATAFGTRSDFKALQPRFPCGSGSLIWRRSSSGPLSFGQRGHEHKTHIDRAAPRHRRLSSGCR